MGRCLPSQSGFPDEEYYRKIHLTEQPFGFTHKPWRQNTFRLVLAPLLTILLFWLAFNLILIPRVEALLMQKKERSLQDISQMAFYQIDYFEEMELPDRSNRELLQKQALESLSEIRLGLNSTDYFFVMDSLSTLIMHPTTPEFVGLTVDDIPGPRGNYPGHELYRIGQEDGSGHTMYSWSYPEDPSRAERKMTYVAKYQPWNWIVGNGAFLTDVREELRSTVTVLRNSAMYITAAIILLVAYISRISFITEKKRIEADERREVLLRELQEAVDRINTLRGLLPICAKCKKIRDDSGYWQNVEQYITLHLDTQFSHGLCPDCRREAMQELSSLSDTSVRGKT